MAKWSQIMSLVLLAGVTLIAGCASAPTQEMSDARQSLQAARDAGAATHAPDILDNAEQLLQEATDGLGKRSYKLARDNAETARESAIKARNIAIAIGTAKIVVNEAQSLGVYTDTIGDLMDKASIAAKAGDERTAIFYANSASEHARHAISNTRPRTPQDN